MEKTECIECGGYNLEDVEFKEGVDGFASYLLKCEDCGEKFGVVYDNGVILEYF